MRSGRNLVSIPSSFLVLALLLAASPAVAQTRTPWQMHDGLEVTAGNPLGLIAFTCDPRWQHGNACEYEVATIPPAADPGWGPAPSGETIAFSVYPSRVCSAPVTCWDYGDFTYFQTFVDVPANVVVTAFTITFSGMDDGSRVSISNSLHPAGVVIPGSYVYLGGSGTTDLASFVVSGEVNRVVVTQVDDCCIENNLDVALVVLNGEVVETGCSSAADCDDGDACTADLCNQDGTCSQAPLSCDDGSACTSDACDPGTGCVYQPVACDDASACTTDACDPAVGCVYQPVSCDDGNACTADICDPATGCSSSNQCPDCGGASATVPVIWPPNHQLVAVGVAGVSDPQGQPTGIRIDAVWQDEPTDALGDGSTCGDASGVGTSQAVLRAERSGNRQVPGDGRVYHVLFTATDPDGYSCSGEALSCVPHDMRGGGACVDGGALFESLVCH